MQSSSKLTALKTIRLCPFRVEHAEHIARWAEKDANAEFFRRMPPIQDWLTPDLIKQVYGTAWVIYEDDMPVGLLTAFWHDQASRSVEYGILVDKEESNHKSSTATEIMHQALEYAFHYRNMHKVYVRLLEGREGLKAKLESLGFTTEATLRDSVYFKGEYRNEYYLSCLKLEYKGRNS